MNNTEVQAIISQIKADADIYIFGISFLFIGLSFFFVFFMIKKQLKQTLAFSVVAITSGINLIGQAPSKAILFGSFEFMGVDLWTLSLYILPLGFLSFVEGVLNYRPLQKKIIRILFYAMAAHALVITILDLAGICDITVTLPYFGPAIVLTVMITLFHKYEKSAPAQTKILLVGMYWCSAVCMLHGILMNLSLGTHRPVLQWGIFVLILSFLLSMLAQFKSTHMLQVQQAAELAQKNEELHQALAEVDSLNKSLESRVQDRTEQLTCANEELQAINEDLTQTMNRLVETQSKLVQSEKISALSTLVAGIAHEINTPIAAIQSNLQLEEVLFSDIDYTNPESMHVYLQNVPAMRKNNLMATKRVAEIIRDMKNFARLDESEFKVANINVGIESTLTLLNHKLLDKNISVTRDLGAIPDIFCVPRQINQLVLILLTNAIEAVSREGQIRIATGVSNDNIAIRISDNGCGIPQKNLSKIFNPGFTSKGVGVGTGLGLAIASKIVDQHKGTITVESQEGRGATFTISIPVNHGVKSSEETA
jgi:signal transduction histidine kinase